MTTSAKTSGAHRRCAPSAQLISMLSASGLPILQPPGAPPTSIVGSARLRIYGYLNVSSRVAAIEREAQSNIELMWLTGRLAPDFKTIADFRHNNGKGIRNVCRRFIVLCRQLKLFSQAVVAIDGSKFKAVNSRDRNFSPGKIDGRTFTGGRTRSAAWLCCALLHCSTLSRAPGGSAAFLRSSALLTRTLKERLAKLLLSATRNGMAFGKKLPAMAATPKEFKAMVEDLGMTRKSQQCFGRAL